MPSNKHSLELTFLGSGNAFGAEGRAFSSFILHDRYLFDCGPTVLQQLRKAGMSSDDVDVVFISHFHADHYFGLPFLMLDAWRNRRVHELVIVGPPGIAARTEALFETAFPGLPNFESLKRRYIEISDGLEAEAAGLAFTAVAVNHVPNLDCFAFRVQHRGRSLVYSGDACLCDGLLKIVPGADVVVVECSCSGDVVHLSAAGVDEVRRHAPDAQFIVTHLDGHDHPDGFRGLHVAADLARFKF